MTLAPPLWAQNLPYPAAVDRLLVGSRLESGAISSDAVAVTQRSNGANMSVDISPGVCIIAGSVGAYLCQSTAVENRPIAAAPASGSRRDLIYARVRDSQTTGTTGQDDWVIDVQAGVASGSPVDPTLPVYAIALARVNVPAGTASITTGNITDLRTSAEDATKWNYRPVGGRNGQLLRGNDVPLVYNNVRNDWLRLQPATYNGLSEYGESWNGVATAPVDPGISVRSFVVFSHAVGPATVTAAVSVTGASTTASSGIFGVRLGVAFDGVTYTYSEWAYQQTLNTGSLVNACNFLTVTGTYVAGGTRITAYCKSGGGGAITQSNQGSLTARLSVA